MRTITLVNQSTVVADADFQAVAAALQQQLDYHVQPLWGLTARLAVLPTGQQAAAGVETIVVLDDSDQADALGYHETVGGDVPAGFVFARTCQQAGVSWSSCASHELIEQLIDPLTDAQTVAPFAGHRNAAVMRETCDAVEADSYLLSGIELSNFVTPHWFDPDSPGPWDYLAQLTGPLSLTSGGYVAYTRDLNHWQQVVKGELRPHRAQLNHYCRRTRKDRLKIPD